jgi:tetratricopeptide (TPR) repeat protein
MKRILLVCFTFLYLNTTYACLNYYYGIDRQGHLHETSDFSKGFHANFDRKTTITLLKKLEDKLEKQHHYMLLSDYAVGLMKLGKYKEAQVILQELYNYYPEDYKIAANLGTAYELNGDPASALTYIRRGIGLNPDEHEGSEWVHVQILETKLALQKDPSYLQSHTVLELDPEKEKNEDVCRHISIQVRERFPFSPGPDPIMADLLTDLGDCYANLYSVEYARAVYEIAREYYGDKSPQLLAKITEMKKLAQKFILVKPGNRERGDENGLEREGEHNRIGAVNYKRLLIFNDDKKSVFDLVMVNTDTTALLSLADLSQTARQAKRLALSETDSSGLVLIDEDTITAIAPEKNKLAEKMNTGQTSHAAPWYTWMISIPATLVVVWLIARVIKKDRNEPEMDDL